MSIQKMSLVQLSGNVKRLDDVLFRCAMASNFHPEEASQFLDKNGGYLPVSQENPYTELINKIVDISANAGFDIVKQSERTNNLKKKSLGIFKKNIQKVLTTTKKVDSSISAHIHKLEEALENISKQSDSNATICAGDIFACEYLKVRFGIIPNNNVQTAMDYDSNKVVFTPAQKEGDITWALYFTTKENLEEIHDYLDTLGFEEVWIPTISAEDTHKEIESADKYLEKVKLSVADLTERKQTILANIEQYEGALDQLQHIKKLPVSLDELFSCKYLKIRFGRVPNDSYDKLQFYSDKLFVFHELSQDSQYHWGIYITTLEDEVEVDDIFASLYFERIWIPEFVHGTPNGAAKEIYNQLQAEKFNLKEINKKISAEVKDNHDDFIELYLRFNFLNDAFGLRSYVGVVGNYFRLVGFIPTKEKALLEKNFANIEDVTVDILPPQSDERVKVPTLLKNNWFSKPFEMFVHMYGLPSYNDFDPTTLFAITYTLLFGIMFGDFGQGLLFAIMGFVISKKTKNPIGGILERLGICSAIFGFLYGSVFGLENVLDPFYINVLGLEGKPIHVMEPATTSTLLVTALGLGVLLILISMIVNVYVGFKHKDYERALFSNNGVAGVVFYQYLIISSALKLTTDINLFKAPYVIGLAVIPLILIFLKHPLGMLVKREKIVFEEGIGGFVTEGIFELFEVVLSFVTNTMSFLRVGGFILSHAGMMMVVLTLSEMMSFTGSIFVMIIGNLFVMALEGFIVAIQALRLEFYEMFSRYFDGDGEPFNPIHIGTTDKSSEL